MTPACINHDNQLMAVLGYNCTPRERQRMLNHHIPHCHATFGQNNNPNQDLYFKSKKVILTLWMLAPIDFSYVCKGLNHKCASSKWRCKVEIPFRWSASMALSPAGWSALLATDSTAFLAACLCLCKVWQFQYQECSYRFWLLPVCSSDHLGAREWCSDHRLTRTGWRPQATGLEIEAPTIRKKLKPTINAKKIINIESNLNFNNWHPISYE